CPNGICCPLLHLGVASLDGVELNSAMEFTCISRRNRCASHTNSIVLTSENNNFITLNRFSFNGLASFGIADSASEHNHFIETKLSGVFLVFKGQYRTCN